MPTRNVDLTEHDDQFARNLVQSGRFASVSDVLHAGLQMLQQQALEEEEKLTTLRAAAAEGFEELDRGLGIVLDSSEDLTNFVRALGRHAAAQLENRAAGE